MPLSQLAMHASLYYQTRDPEEAVSQRGRGEGGVWKLRQVTGPQSAAAVFIRFRPQGQSGLGHCGHP